VNRTTQALLQRLREQAKRDTRTEQEKLDDAADRFYSNEPAEHEVYEHFARLRRQARSPIAQPRRKGAR
jgi:hypothetical protein